MAAEKRIDISKADESLFSKEELAEINKAAELEVQKLVKADARAALVEKAKRAARARALPEEEMQQVAINLPRFALFVMLDGTQYFHNKTYSLPRRQADCVRDIISCAWRHEDTAFGNHDPNAYRRELNSRVGAGTHIALRG